VVGVAVRLWLVHELDPRCVLSLGDAAVVLPSGGTQFLPGVGSGGVMRNFSNAIS
jgi:hypothetical protein